jgi:hypothetical protein
MLAVENGVLKEGWTAALHGSVAGAVLRFCYPRVLARSGTTCAGSILYCYNMEKHLCREEC